jgi:lysylphosphatidylglycerol synthetase-like protein (DUF2156 family)
LRKILDNKSDSDSQSHELIARYSDHPSAFIAYNDGTTLYRSSSAEGAIAYRQRGKTTFIFGGPSAPHAQRAALLDCFMNTVVCAGNVVVVQLRESDLGLFADRGFSVNKFGSSYSVDLQQFTTAGKQMKNIRQTVSRARRQDFTVQEIDPSDNDAQLDSIDRQWLGTKGANKKQLDFMVGQRGGRGARHRRLFIGMDSNDHVIAYVSFSPTYGSSPGWLCDLAKRSVSAGPGITELIILSAIEKFKQEGCAWMHLGFTPFTNISDDDHPAASKIVEQAVRLLASRGECIYPARTQEFFKKKWAPHRIEPEYLAFLRGPRFSSIWHLLRITNSI